MVYAFAPGPKAPQAFDLLSGATISVQVLNEFASVAIRKLGYDEEQLSRRIASIRTKAAAISVNDEQTHDLAREVAFRYKLAFYDASLLAAALLADCDTFFSEDIQDGLVIDETLTIRNPFAC